MSKVDGKSGYFKIHNVGFYNLAPRQIKCLAYNKQTLKLAVSRDDASIEIWDMRAAVYMEKCILGQPSSSVEGLGWLNNRLFSTGQTGELIEWNLKELKPKKKVTLTGNGAWCMDIDNVNDCIAVGTNEGHLNAFSVNGDDLNHSKPFDKQEGPILCCKYGSKGRYIVTGSTDSIRVYDTVSSLPLLKMNTGRSEKNRETNVWSLVVLKDMTIIAGDSRGCITVWNGDKGTQIDSIDNALDADVLTVAVNDEETMFCCSGVDPKIKIYVPVQREAGAQRKWIRNLRRSIHDHDVKALTFINEKKIISGGVDGFINVSCSTKDLIFDQRKYGPFLPQPCAVVAMPTRLLLLKFFNYLEVWRLGTPSARPQLMAHDDDGAKKNFLSMDQNQTKLVELKSRNEEPITCASISPNGSFLIYSTENIVRLFQLDTQTEKASLANVRVASDKFTPCAKVLFSTDSSRMYCVKTSGDIEIFSLSYNDDVDFKGTISTKEVIKDSISLVCLSKCGKYLVCAGACGTTAVWTSNGNRWSYSRKFSKQSYAPTAMAMHSKSSRIVLAYADYKIVEYDLKTGTIICATDASFRDERRLKSSSDMPINNILLEESNENVVLCQNDSLLFSLKKDKPAPLRKKQKSEESRDTTTMEIYKLVTHIGNYEHFVHMAWLSRSEIVAINVDPVTLIEQLPPVMAQKHFGVS